tara:strand:- start:211 stop:417 length:207 start_codon:yes stop_codon:yes gene_type:complete
MKKLVNGKLVNLTAEEITARKAEEQKEDVKIQEFKNAKADAIAKKASGKQKLLDLGLSEEEVKALIGV